MRPNFRSLLAVTILLTALSHAGHAQSANPVITAQVLKQVGTRWTFTFRYPTLTAAGALMGVKANLRDLNARMLQIAQKEFAHFKKNLADFGPPPPAFAKNKSVSDAKYTVVTDTAGIVSVHWEVYEMYAGGAHPTVKDMTSNWVATLGFVELAGLFKPASNWHQIVSAQALQQIQAIAKKRGYGDVPTLSDEDLEHFVITKAGLRIYHGYFLSYAGGHIDSLLPWSALKDVLKPELAASIAKL